MEQYTETNEPTIWFVVQKDTFTEDKGMRYLWAPQRARDGRRMVHWDSVLQVKKGDIIFHYAQKALRGVSVAESDGYELKNADEQSPWGEEGYGADIQMTRLEPLIAWEALENQRKALKESLAGITNHPLASDGRIKQGYLFEFSKEAGKLVRDLYGRPFGEPTIDAFFDRMEQPAAPAFSLSVKNTVRHIHDYVAAQGFRYGYDEIANCYLALRAKPFVILAGISGTSKTQLPRKIAEALGFAREQVVQIAVRPDWADSSDLLGYTSLDNTFHPKELTLAIQRAAQQPEKPFFFILDEMNLARVEHYFSDFLSIIETRRRVGDRIGTDPILRREMVAGAKNADQFPELAWPQNLYLVGTVNMDETTHAFSRKVLDRANTIEMNEIDLNWVDVPETKPAPLAGVPNALFEAPFVTAAELTAQNRADINYEMQLLQKINKILQRADLHFAYRVRDEIAFYLVLNATHDLLSHKAAFDFQLVQKVLPRIHGSSERVLYVLVELLNQLEGTAFKSTDFDFARAQEALGTKELVYPRASGKVLFMLQRFDDDRFTSFWL